MAEPAGRTVLVVNGRVIEMPAHRTTDRVRLESSPAWWGSLAWLGGALVVLGAFVGAGLGSATTIIGVSLFFATAILSGAELYEFATAVGASAVLWTSAGISVYLGADPSLVASMVALVVLGLVMLGAASVGIARTRSSDASHPQPAG